MATQPEGFSPPPERSLPDLSGGYVVKNTLTSPQDLQFSYIPSMVGKGYAPYHHRYIGIRESLGGKQMRAERYARIVNDVAEERLHDHLGSRATTILVVANVRNENRQEAVATSRVLREADKRWRGRPRLESTKLTTPDTEDEWGSVIKPNARYGDLGLVVVVKELSKRGLATEIIQEMVDGTNGVREVAMQQGIDYLIADMQHRLQRHIEHTGLEIVQELPLKLTWAGRRTSRKFPGYWEDEEDPPHIVVMKVPKKTSDVVLEPATESCVRM